MNPTTSDPDRDHLKRWDSLTASLGFQSFLSPADGFARCSRTRRRWRGRRPGIYCWVTEEGEAYVGQSVRPRSRLKQHQKYWRDIVQACFLPCPRAELDASEARLVTALEQHFPLRNIKLALSTSRHVPFDTVVSQAEQQRFAAGGDLEDGFWSERPELTRKQQHRFEQFLGRSDSATTLRALHAFVDRAIPKPAATEAWFWSTTVYRQGCFIRLNVGQQEVFTVDGQSGEIRILADSRQSWFGAVRAPYTVRSYVHAVAPSRLDSWLAGKRLLAVRRLVIQLMRHTNAINSASHCPQAVRHVLA